MNIKAKSVKMEKKHVENLRHKLRRDLPEQMCEVETFAEAEHRKEICDSIHQGGKQSRHGERKRAIEYELSLMES